MTTTTNNFLKGVEVPLEKIVSDRLGFSYISRFTAELLYKKEFGKPFKWYSTIFSSTGQETDSEGEHYLKMFRGGVVKVKHADGNMVTWLPIMDNKKNAMPANEITARDVHDSVMRATVKLIAMETGVGFTLFTKYKSVNELKKRSGLNKEILEQVASGEIPNLFEINPLIEKKQLNKSGSLTTEYIPWWISHFVMKTTDPSSYWEPVVYQLENPKNGGVLERPFSPAGEGFMVKVRINWMGLQHEETLPIMGTVQKNGKNYLNAALPNPTTRDWNDAVMRCFAKGFASISGYGAEVYANEEASILKASESECEVFDRAATIDALHAKIEEKGRSIEQIMEFLKSSYPNDVGENANSLEEIPDHIIISLSKSMLK